MSFININIWQWLRWGTSPEGATRPCKKEGLMSSNVNMEAKPGIKKVANGCRGNNECFPGGGQRGREEPEGKKTEMRPETGIWKKNLFPKTNQGNGYQNN